MKLLILLYLDFLRFLWLVSLWPLYSFLFLSGGAPLDFFFFFTICVEMGCLQSSRFHFTPDILVEVDEVRLVVDLGSKMCPQPYLWCSISFCRSTENFIRFDLHVRRRTSRQHYHRSRQRLLLRFLVWLRCPLRQRFLPRIHLLVRPTARGRSSFICVVEAASGGQPCLC